MPVTQEDIEVFNGIKQINSRYRYEDKNPGGKRDRLLVSCGQCGSYNELGYIYERKLRREVNSGFITAAQAVDILNACCTEIKNPRKRTQVYELIAERLTAITKQ